MSLFCLIFTKSDISFVFYLQLYLFVIFQFSRLHCTVQFVPLIRMNVKFPPPSQDSPKHILNSLNDDCIQAIFCRLENVQDFLSAAETCIRFQENAKLTFHKKYKKIEINDSDFAVKKTFRHIVTSDRVKSLLSIFGHSIIELIINGSFKYGKSWEDILNMFADYSGRSLKILKFYGHEHLQINFETKSPLQALEELYLNHTTIYNFKYHSQLKRLCISGNSKSA